MNEGENEFLKRRRLGLRRTFNAGRDRSKPFQERVKASRASCVAEVLFAENGASDLKPNPGLRLPTRQQAEHLLDIYKEDVQCVSNILIIDLNRARINSFLDWWHSRPDEMPIEADAPLAPLVLVVLALSLQAKRARDALLKPATGSSYSSLKRPSSNEAVYSWISTERYLLETAGRCINALQVVCPSSWAAAYSAPLDIIRAEALRAVWHLGECHLQFTANCLSVAVRLAYAAGLHRDPKHWMAAKMGAFEAQARRSIWWNIVALEVFHSLRLGQPTTISHQEMDTQLPIDFDTIVEQYEITRNPYGPPSRLAFDALSTRFTLAKLMVTKGGDIWSLRDRPSHDIARSYQGVYSQWAACISDELRVQMNEAQSLEQWRRSPADGRWEVIGLQLSLLQGRVAPHRLKGGPNSIETSSTIKMHLQAASRVVALCHQGITGQPHVPASLLNIFVHYLFNTGSFLAIQSVSAGSFKQFCKHALDQTLSALDTLANNYSLYNVSELAAKYASTVREICSTRLPLQQGTVTCCGFSGSGEPKVSQLNGQQGAAVRLPVQYHINSVAPSSLTQQARPLDCRNGQLESRMLSVNSNISSPRSAASEESHDVRAPWKHFNASESPPTICVGGRNVRRPVSDQGCGPHFTSAERDGQTTPEMMRPVETQNGEGVGVMGFDSPSGFLGTGDATSLTIDRPLQGRNYVSPSLLSALITDMSDDQGHSDNMSLDFAVSAGVGNAMEDSLGRQALSPWSDGNPCSSTSAISAIDEVRDTSLQRPEHRRGSFHCFQPSGPPPEVSRLRGAAVGGQSLRKDSAHAGEASVSGCSDVQFQSSLPSRVAVPHQQPYHNSNVNHTDLHHERASFGSSTGCNSVNLNSASSPLPSPAQGMQTLRAAVGPVPQSRNPTAISQQQVPGWQGWDCLISTFLHDTHGSTSNHTY